MPSQESTARVPSLKRDSDGPILPTWGSQIPQFYEDTFGAKKAVPGLSLAVPNSGSERGATVKLTDEDFERQRAAASSRRRVLDSLSGARSRQQQQPLGSGEDTAAWPVVVPDSSLMGLYDKMVQSLRSQQGMERIELRYKGI